MGAGTQTLGSVQIHLLHGVDTRARGSAGQENTAAHPQRSAGHRRHGDRNADLGMSGEGDCGFMQEVVGVAVQPSFVISLQIDATSPRRLHDSRFLCEGIPLG
ncbi:hypothetical protein [uncultured Nevskia sp.]|uniref:hypothetical protein n=1 Tax=uncultured Nevskia sp. TaxID=228950 RepID=UPI002600E1C6|nr:hypothetical protein [uncultured Nevskia sp.]